MEGGEGVVHGVDDGGRQAEAGLVEQQQLGLAHQRPADRQHLALAARHGAGTLAAPLGKPREHRIDALEQARDAAAIGQRRGAQHQVVLDTLLGEEPPALGRQRQALAHDGVGRQARDVLAAELDGAAGHRGDAGDGVQRRGLAGAVRPEQRHDRAARHFQGDVGHADQVAVAHLEMGHAQQRGARRYTHGPAPCRTLRRPR